MEDKPVIDPSALSEPGSSREFQLRAYALYTKGDYKGAVSDFDNALSLDANDVEALYGLALSYKMLGSREESTKAFQKVLDLLAGGSVKNATRAKMLERLTKGHLNFMSIGDWNLEKEIWKRSD